MSHPRVLIVEDHPLMADALRVQLHSLLLQMTCIHAHSLQQGLLCLQQTPNFALVLVDLNLPDSQGLDTLNAICAARFEGALVVVTALEDVEVRQACLANNVSYISKSSSSFKLKTDLLAALPKLHHAASPQLPGMSAQEASPHPIDQLSSKQRLVLTLLANGSFHALAMIHVAWIYWRQDKSSANALFLGVWLVYLSSVVVYWMYRWLEWPLFTTLGVQFVQGAAVATLLGLSACLQVFKERQQLQQHVLVAKAKERWYAATQHDLWQPLQSVQLYAQALLEAPVHQRKTLINGLRLASQSIDDFMNQLRFLVDGDASPTGGLSTQTVEVHALLAALVSEFMPLAQMRHVLLRYRPCHAKVVIDQRAVQRMVRNLLTNALHYTPAGGRVLLTCQKRAEVLWLLCIDNGVGMSKAQMDACFEAFTRFDQNHQTNKLGLGLFSFKQLAMQHQMPTRLQSVQGKGTLVGFGMPLMNNGETV